MSRPQFDHSGDHDEREGIQTFGCVFSYGGVRIVEPHSIHVRSKSGADSSGVNTRDQTEEVRCLRQKRRGNLKRTAPSYFLYSTSLFFYGARDARGEGSGA